MAHPTLLTYNLSPAALNGLSEICRAQDIWLRQVARGEYDMPIGALAGIPIARAREASAVGGFDDEMLVMCHMLSNQLDAFLQAMRESGIRSIALKAVLTPSNVAWDSVALHRELAREHEAMRRRAR